LWSLDDQCDYISYIVENERKFYDFLGQWEYSGFTPTSGESGNVVEFPSNSELVNEKFIFRNSAVTKINPPAVLEGETGSFSIDSRFYIPVTAKTFSVALYSYSDVDLESITITAYSDVGDGYTDSQEFTNLPKDRQNHLSATFETSVNLSEVHFLIEIEYPYSSAQADIYLSGFSVGSLSEEFSAVSLGIEDYENIPESIALSERYGVRALAYGSDNNFGYYIVKDITLLAKNSSIPMVYGASNSTIMHANTEGEPSLILPGKGFLNAKGQSSTLTFEAWLKVNSNNASQRIMGPIASEDGLYVDGPFLVFRVGNKTCSHFVGEWFRPMLVDLVVSSSSAAMLVNGEYVASIDLSQTIPNYASPQDEASKDQDWIGFYSYGNVASLEVDCVAIYPYEVTEVLAKKRFVAGQGVPYPQDVNIAYSGESIFIDYIYANYTKNYEYPATSSWLQGAYDNIDVTTKRLSSPTYSLPQISSSGGSSFNLNKLENDLQEEMDGITIKSLEDWSDKKSYLYFDSLNILQKPVSAIFGVFKKENSDTSTNRQTLIKISNKLNQDYLLVSLEGTTLKYSYKQSGQAEVAINYSVGNETYTITKDEKFAAGFNIEKIVIAYPSLRQFFSNRSQLSLQILGDYSGEEDALDTTFLGYAYSLGFCTSKNLKEFSTFFSNSGILDAEEFEVSGGSYELVYKNLSGIGKLEIKTRSYWESHVPLASLSKIITNSDGQDEDRIDFVQINLDYPQTRSVETAEFDPRNDLVKAYISFQYMADGANKPLTDFENLSVFDSDNIDVVEPGKNLEDWKETKYQVIDGTVIYLPEFEDNDSYAEVALCLHLEINAKASLHNKVLTRFIKLGAQSFSDNSSVAINPTNKIGTKFGKGMYAYKAVTANSFPSNISYTAKNPFKIFRGSGPHLYLTNNSGIAIAGEYDEDIDRGVFARLNREATADTNISSIQMAMLWNNRLFPEEKQKIFEIDASTGVYKFFVEAIDSDRRRGKITVTLTSGNTTTETNNVSFYWNGNQVANPVMTIGEWGMVGVVFKPYLVFNNSVGYFKLTSPMLINNISTYQLDAASQAQQIVYKTWQDIEENVAEDEWDEWYNPGVLSRTWEDAFYRVATFNPSIDPVEIYKIYIGTNKIISNSSSQAGNIELNKYQYVTYNDVQRDAYQVSLL
jgi:hypothetical protein